MNWADVLQVYQLHISDDANSLSEFMRDLSVEELCECEQILDPVRRRARIWARANLRRILASRLKTEPQLIALARTQAGKPVLRSSTTRLQFSYSISEDLIVFALSDCAAIGIDVEVERTVEDARSILNRAGLANVPGVSSAESSFITVWTSCEAVLKADGTGLSALGELRFRKRLGSGWIVSLRDQKYVTSRCRAPDGYICSIATTIL